MTRDATFEPRIQAAGRPPKMPVQERGSVGGDRPFEAATARWCFTEKGYWFQKGIDHDHDSPEELSVSYRQFVDLTPAQAREHAAEIMRAADECEACASRHAELREQAR